MITSFLEINDPIASSALLLSFEIWGMACSASKRTWRGHALENTVAASLNALRRASEWAKSWLELASMEEFRVKVLIWVSNAVILPLRPSNETAREAYWRVARLAEEASLEDAKKAHLSNERRIVIV
jgi:hypothetical protein